MNALPVADEGDPAKRLTSSLTAFAFFLYLFVFSACTNKSATKPPPAPAPDSNYVKAQEQRKADSIAALPGKRKKIYLTFDDGPNKGTRNVLEVIRTEQVPASFFVVGQHTLDTRQQKETWEMLKADDSIELCNHSFSHAHNKYTSFYEDPSGVISDFNQSKNLLGITNNVVRMPGRNAWRIDTIDHTDIAESKAAIDSLHEAGYAIMGWDIEWTFDHKTLAPDADTALLLRRIHNMLEANKTKTSGHLVLLAHDQAYQKEEYVAELRYVIRSLKNNPEYQLVLASEYPGVR